MVFGYLCADIGLDVSPGSIVSIRYLSSPLMSRLPAPAAHNVSQATAQQAAIAAI